MYARTVLRPYSPGATHEAPAGTARRHARRLRPFIPHRRVSAGLLGGPDVPFRLDDHLLAYCQAVPARSGLGTAHGRGLLLCSEQFRGGRTWGNLFFNDSATSEIYTLSLHDSLPLAA